MQQTERESFLMHNDIPENLMAELSAAARGSCRKEQQQQYTSGKAFVYIREPIGRYVAPDAAMIASRCARCCQLVGCNRQSHEGRMKRG